MLYISTLQEPGILDLQSTIHDCCKSGIKLADTRELMCLLDDNYYKNLDILRRTYGIKNPNSPKQVIEVFKSLARSSAPEIETVCCDADTGKWSTKAENLEDLVRLGVPIAGTLMNYRTLSNMRSTITSFESCKDRNGLVHPTISYGKTGRINYSTPALMNVNKKILWHMIEARDADCTLFSIDIKNQEPWILINSLGIEELVNVLNPEKGLYDSIFRQWYSRDFINEVERAEFKQSWNALTYGGTKHGIESRCKILETDILYYNFTHIEELANYKKLCYANGYKNKRVCKTFFGRELECDGARGAALSRQLMDYPIQGTGVDILAFLNTNLSDQAMEYGYSEMVRPYFFRHDEVIVEVDNVLLETVGDAKVLEFLKDTFEHKIDEWVPFNVKITEIAGLGDIELGLVSN